MLRDNRGGIRFDDPDLLGDRDLDRQYPWQDYVYRYPDSDIYEFGPLWWQNAKSLWPVDSFVASQSQGQYIGLNPEQDVIYKLFIQHHQQSLHQMAPPQILLQVDGKSGTGKSYTIRVLSAHLQRNQRWWDEDHGLNRNLRPINPVIRTAPTGVASGLIDGSTLYSLLLLPVQAPFRDLPQAKLQSLQKVFKNVLYLLIDEKSMIHLKMLHYIDRRLRQIMAKPYSWFGGLSIALLGDFHQLLPVNGRALFTSHLGGQEERDGRAAYLMFNRTVELKLIQRQDGQDPVSLAFKHTLEAMRHNRVTEVYWKLLLTRTSVDPIERQLF